MINDFITNISALLPISAYLSSIILAFLFALKEEPIKQ
jgi:hypothetical protein